MIEFTPADTNPTEPGWYACRLRLSDRPVVLWWGVGQQWRMGLQAVDVRAWAGPL